MPVVVVTPGTSAERTLLDAEAAFARRPDLDAAKEALALFRTAALADVAKVDGPIGVVRTAAWLVENGPKAERKLRAAEAVEAGQQCQQRAPGSAGCDYWQAVALGLSARERALTAVVELPNIIALLKKADATAPGLDDAGPARVLALLLVRAPGWPTGPGNADDALAEAQKAVSRAPQHPLNQATLAECLAATGDTAAARAAYARAIELGTARGDADGAAWATQARAALAGLD
ncbi:MAG: hypothetical protein JNJ54_30710 [Myxococcaceae bacterium]|nr:hypothetical protein [Myxococcaceae bacterium]